VVFFGEGATRIVVKDGWSCGETKYFEIAKNECDLPADEENVLCLTVVERMRPR
jgi:hypothetical protein